MSVTNRNEVDICDVDQEFMYCFNPSALYKIEGIKAVYTRGVFNTLAGAFVAYEYSLDRSKVEILIEECNCSDYLDIRPFWIDLGTLELAEGCICCEYCDKFLYPKVTGWNSGKDY